MPQTHSPRRYTRLPVRSFAVIFCVIATAAHVDAQEYGNSPVFRGYRPRQQKSRPQNPDPAQQWRDLQLVREANAGDQFAQHELGLRYLFGDGFQADTAKAAYWIGKAASQKLALANYNYGLLLANGWGITWDPFAAYRHIRFAAERGQTEAQHVLGLTYTENLVVARDWKTALKWVRLAADSGFVPSRALLPELESIATRNGVSDSIAQSVSDSDEDSNPGSSGTWSPVLLDFRRDTVPSQPDARGLARDAIATAGLSGPDSTGVYALATGDSTDQTLLHPLFPAADVGNPEVLTFLGYCIQEGMGMTRDPVHAAELYIRAIYMESPRAAQLLWTLTRTKGFLGVLQARVSEGETRAMFVQSELVALEFDGHITERQAYDLLLKAAERGSSIAEVHLGICHQTGRWVTQNKEKALFLWRRAATAGNAEAAIRAAGSTLLAPDAVDIDAAQHLITLRRADTHGSILARVAIARMLEAGVVLPRNPGAATRLYRGCAQRGSRAALEALRRMHDSIRPSDPLFRIPSGTR
ncbi:MAG: SEL1-like repeat protein [Ignavibacteriae bacterium]|nr:SEL1-like repeat protein [Ignavibacteriota bacterium]